MGQLLSSLGHIPAIAVYLFVLLWLAFESCGVPVPNEIVLLLAGSLTAQQDHTSGLSPLLLVLVATAGSLVGASAAYALGMRGGRAAVLRFGRYIRLDETRLDGIEAWFARTGPVAIFVSRITPFVRTIASFPAGMLRLPQRSFLLASGLGSLIWCAALVTLGHVLGANYGKALKLIEEYTIPAVIVLVALVAGYFWLHTRLSHVGTRKVTPAEAQAVHEREARE